MAPVGPDVEQALTAGCLPQGSPQAFSLEDPKPGAPRFRLAKNDGGKTYENLHRGARSFADGLYTAIRNPGMHKPPASEGGEEQVALEQLAAFSLLARWVDQAEVERA